jgi:hypothetical protein
MDLAGHPQVFLADDKEPHNLCRDDVLTPEGRAAYEAIYAKARPGQLCVDASTGYSKRPDFEGVAQRAVQVLPPDFKVVYLVRHPIDRIVSQHHHEHVEGKVGPSIDEEVRRHPRYVQYSSYNYQLEPWIEAIGLERIRVIRFEDYVAARGETLRALCDYLGLSPEISDPSGEEVYNKSQGKPIKGPVWNYVQHHPLYRRYLRSLAPVKLRLAVRGIIFRKAKAQLDPPSNDTIQYLREKLSADVQGLEQLLRRESPLWEDF